MKRIELYGVCGWDYSAQTILWALQEAGDNTPLQVRVSSVGGSFREALTIYNRLLAHPSAVEVIVDGSALSCAALIVLAGSRRAMPANGRIMIHEARIEPQGMMTAAELESLAAMARDVNAQATAVIQSRTELTAEQIAEMLAAETWLDAQAALDAGFLTEILDQSAAADVRMEFDPVRLGIRPERVPSDFCLLQARTMPQQFAACMVHRPAPSQGITPMAESTLTTPAAPATPAVPVASPQMVSLADVERLKQDAVNAALKADADRRTAIMQACMDGFGDTAEARTLADQFIADPQMSAEAAQRTVLSRIAATRKVTTAVGNDDGTGRGAVDPQMKYRDEYRAQKQVFEAAGITEDQYVASRAKDA